MKRKKRQKGWRREKDESHTNMWSKDDIRKNIEPNYKAGANAKDLFKKNLDWVKSTTVYNIYKNLEKWELYEEKVGLEENQL